MRTGLTDPEGRGGMSGNDPGPDSDVRWIVVRGLACCREATEKEREAGGTGDPREILVSAPARVRAGWGFDPRGTGDERFLEPLPPPGWAYDAGSGTFYREGPDRDEETEEA